MIKYFRSRVRGVLRESPELEDPSNIDVMVATMNGLTDEAWAVGCFFEKVTNRTVVHCDIQILQCESQPHLKMLPL